MNFNSLYPTHSMNQNLNASIYYLQDGTPYSYDECGKIFYYSPQWKTYYIDENGNNYFYDDNNQKIFFYFDELKNFIIKNDHLETNFKNEINESVEFTEKNSENLSDEELFKLFDISNDDFNIKLPFLSDHTIIWYKIKENEEEEISIASWNLLYRADKNQEDQSKWNNTWQIVETREDYENRFQKQILKILDIIHKTDISLFLLQEALLLYQSSYFTNFLSELKKNNWNILKAINCKKNVILYNKNRFSVSNIKKNLIAKHEMQLTYLKEKISKKKFILGNYHFSPRTADKFMKIYPELQKRHRNLLRIFGGDSNGIKNICIGNQEFPTYVTLDKIRVRLDNFFFLLPNNSYITVTQMPICYFNENFNLSLSTKKISKITSSDIDRLPTLHLINKNKLDELTSSDIDRLPFLHLINKNKLVNFNNNPLFLKLSQKLDLSYLPYGKSFLSYQDSNKFEYLLYGTEKLNNFIQAIKPFDINNQEFQKSEKITKFYFNYKEMAIILEKLMDSSYFSFIFNTKDTFSITNKNDLFQEFIPHSKKEIKRKRVEVLLISDDKELVSYEYKKTFLIKKRKKIQKQLKNQ